MFGNFQFIFCVYGEHCINIIRRDCTFTISTFNILFKPHRFTTDWLLLLITSLHTEFFADSISVLFMHDVTKSKFTNCVRSNVWQFLSFCPTGRDNVWEWSPLWFNKMHMFCHKKLEETFKREFKKNYTKFVIYFNTWIVFLHWYKCSYIVLIHLTRFLSCQYYLLNGSLMSGHIFIPTHREWSAYNLDVMLTETRVGIY